MDEHEGHAARWADAMLLFEPAPRGPASESSSTAVGDEDDYYEYDDASSHHSHNSHHFFHNFSNNHPHQNNYSPNHHHHQHKHSPVKQLHVRRLWNRARLLKRLEELRRRTPTVRSRVGSPVWAAANGGMVHGYAAGGGGTGGNGNGNGNGNGGRMPVGVTVPGVQRGDIWW